MAAFYLTRTGAPGDEIPLPKEEAQHALKVLRLGEGDEIDALDGAGGRFRAVVIAAHGGECVVRLTESLPSNEPPVRLTLYQGLPKADKLEFIVQKLTELGAAAVVPVKMERSVVRTDAKDGEKRRERLSKIAHEAAKQCRRALAPEIAAPLTWKQTLSRMAEHDLILVPWEDARENTLKQAFAAAPEARSIGLVVGPEGGMAAEEIAALKEIGAQPVTLGRRILRAEPAAVAAAAVTMALWGDL